MEPPPAVILAAMLLLAGQTAVAIEEPEFEVLESTEDYEIRHYAPIIVAEVDVTGDFRNAGNKAFRQLAGYIFGDNVPREKMSMTAPVESREGERMAMTAPVLSAEADREGVYTYAFVMERRYSMKSLPQPLDSDIRIVERPERFVAARRYSGRWTESNYRENEQALLRALRADDIEATGPATLARYNAPFTPWFLRRNEVLVEVDWPAGSE